MTARYQCKLCDRVLEIPVNAREVRNRFGIVTYLFPNREVHVFRIVKETAIPAPAAPAPIKPVPVPAVPDTAIVKEVQPEQPMPQPDKFDRFGSTLADAFRNSNFKK
jgi:hypothetical protein